jgi:hypothetical protein
MFWRHRATRLLSDAGSGQSQLVLESKTEFEWFLALLPFRSSRWATDSQSRDTPSAAAKHDIETAIRAGRATY